MIVSTNFWVFLIHGPQYYGSALSEHTLLFILISHFSLPVLIFKNPGKSLPLVFAFLYYVIF